MFGQRGLLYSRSTGTMTFQSQGNGMQSIFAGMRGNSSVTVELRADDDWRRPSQEQGKLAFSGSSSL
ncbi:MAG: hypothetical protein R3E50_12140 [Halioglobus sp.]